MFGLTRKVDYALVALARLAQQWDRHGGPLSARRIADEYHVPQQLLVNVLKDLHRADILGSARGAHGGYYLNVEPDGLRLSRVIEAIDGPIRMVLCCEDTLDEDNLPCELMPTCPVTGAIRRLNDRIGRFFHRVTLRDLLTSEVDLPVTALAEK